MPFFLQYNRYGRVCNYEQLFVSWCIAAMKEFSRFEFCKDHKKRIFLTKNIFFYLIIDGKVPFFSF